MQRLPRTLFRSIPLLIAALLLSLGASFARAITIDMVSVGNPGNPFDVAHGSNPAAGQVNYTYNIGAYEVTNSQYAAFLNAVAATDTNSLYNASMNSSGRGGITQSGSSGSYTYAVKTDFADKPVNYVSFWDAARFTNWLHNGQPIGAQGAGTTEDGAYVLNTTNPVNNTIFRDPNAMFYLPTENEWYKAAYYDPTLNSGAGGYTLYATKSNTAPTIATASLTGDISSPGANVANYFSGADWNSQNGNVTTVGSAGPLSASYYGTFDQSGNLWELNEEILFSSFRGLRGGAWLNSSTVLAASFRNNYDPSDEGADVGFRIASPFLESAPPSNDLVPEPGSGGLLVVGLMLLRRRRWRQKPSFAR